MFTKMKAIIFDRNNPITKYLPDTPVFMSTENIIETREPVAYSDMDNMA